MAEKEQHEKEDGTVAGGQLDGGGNVEDRRSEGPGPGGRRRVARWVVAVLAACLLAGALGGLAVTAGGLFSGEAPEERACATSSGARVCLDRRDHAVVVEASGFRPGSELRLVGNSEATVPIDEQGRIGGTVGFLDDGTEPVREVTAEGVSATGAPVRLTVRW